MLKAETSPFQIGCFQKCKAVILFLPRLLLGYQRTDWFPLRSVHSQCNPDAITLSFPTRMYASITPSAL